MSRSLILIVFSPSLLSFWEVLRQEAQVQIGHAEERKDMSVQDPTAVVPTDGVELEMISAVQDGMFKYQQFSRRKQPSSCLY